MIAARLTLPATPRTDSIPSPATANNTNTANISFERSLSLSQRAAKIKDHARSDELAQRSAPSRKEPAKKSDSSGEKSVDTKAPVESEKVDAKVQQETNGVEATEGEELISDALPDAEVQSTKTETVEPAKAEKVQRAETESEESIVVEEAGDEEAQDIELAQVNAVAVELVQQVTTSLAAAQITTDEVTVQSQSAASVETAQTQAAPITKASTATKVQADVDAVDAEDSVLSSTATRQGDAVQAVSTDDEAATADGDGDAPVKQRGTELNEPQVAHAAKSLLNSESGSHATPVSGAQSTPTVTAGESITAQFAQLPQTPEAKDTDEVNVGRLTRGLNSAINQRGGSVTLKLTPPELGAVRIDMAVRDGVVSAKFTAQTESVRNLLMDQMGQLRQALDRQGLSVDKIEVQLTPQQSSGGSFAGSERQADESNRDGRSAGQYASQGGQGGHDGRERSGRPRVDTFERAMADAVE